MPALSNIQYYSANTSGTLTQELCSVGTWTSEWLEKPALNKPCQLQKEALLHDAGYIE